MKEFKVGDKVYYPISGTAIYTLQSSGNQKSYYPLLINSPKTSYTFTLSGGYYSDEYLPSIFHATEENCELLTKLYGVEFEKPKSKPTSAEIIEHLLTKQKYVPCYVSDESEQHTLDPRCCEIALIHHIDTDHDAYSVSGAVWHYATPFDPATGKFIKEIEE